MSEGPVSQWCYVNKAIVSIKYIYLYVCELGTALEWRLRKCLPMDKEVISKVRAYSNLCLFGPEPLVSSDIRPWRHNFSLSVLASKRMFSLVIESFVSYLHALCICWTFVVTFGHTNPICFLLCGKFAVLKCIGEIQCHLSVKMTKKGQSPSAFLWQPRKGHVSLACSRPAHLGFEPGEIDTEHWIVRTYGGGRQ